jgi:hypothetical protein
MAQSTPAPNPTRSQKKPSSSPTAGPRQHPRPPVLQLRRAGQKVADFLKNSYDGKGVFNVDIFALEKENAAATTKDEVFVAPLGLTAFSLVPGETLVADVVIQNKGIGHSFVPEQRDFYEAWVDFTVKDSAGKTSPSPASSSPTAPSTPEPTPSPTASSTTRASSTTSIRSGTTASSPTTTPSSPAARS